MRENWVRPQAALSPTPDDAAALIRVALPDARVMGLEPVTGGLANSNFRVELAGAATPRVLLRYWQRAPDAAAKEIALLRRVAGQVPAPAVLAAGKADARFGLPWAVLGWVDGERLDQTLARMDADGEAALGRSLGATLAALHGIRFPRTGFLDATLAVATPIPTGRAGLLGYLAHWQTGLGPGRLGTALCTALGAFVAREGHALDAPWAMGATLTHADFDGTNILVRGTQVAAVLDWEFAFAGGLSFDLGHLLRPPMGMGAAFIGGVAAGLRQAGVTLPEGWEHAARIADLYSWLDFLGRETASPRLVADARGMIAAIIGSAPD